ncbi:MAG: hypothetical protein HOP08_17855 [Cyclobacteriaceae bacterium]|nr:hypothetical protein [Cyclobacteriaceae bacterium]
MKTLKSIGAILAGMITIVLLSIATDYILESNDIFPTREEGKLSTWMLALALLYRTVYGIAGGYVTAKLSPSDPMRNAFILGCIGTALSIVGIVIGWDLSDHWYPIALALTALPSVWVGAKFATQ